MKLPVFFLKWTTLVLLLSVGLKLAAQQSPDYRLIDSLTFACYENEQWDCVKQYGEEAISQGYDYYYLRMRLGMAYFVQGHYRLAATHFSKALEYNNHDATARQLLAKSCEWGGMFLDAAYHQKQLGSSLQFVRMLHIYGGFSTNNSKSKTDRLNIVGDPPFYGALDRAGGFNYLRAGLLLEPAGGLRWPVSYSFLSLRKEQFAVTANFDTIYDRHLLHQQQFAFGFPFRIGQGVYVVPEFDLIKISEQPLAVTFDTITLNYRADRYSNNYSNYVASLRLIRELPDFTFGIGLSFSNLNFKQQVQGSLLFTWYPFQNLDLYLHNKVALLRQDDRYQVNAKHLLGIKIANPLWLQGSIHYGQLQNTPDESGALMYNVAGRVVFNASASMVLLLNERISLLLDCSWLEQEANYIQFMDENIFENKSFTFNAFHFKGGIVWKI